MSNILIFGDVHIADRPPGGRVDSYADSIMAKLEGLRTIAQNYQASLAICAGDLFHVKRPHRVSHALVRRLMEHFLSWPCRVLVVPGNHDQGPSGLDGIDRQPLGVLAESGAINLFVEPEIVAGYQVVSVPFDAARDLDPAYYSPGGDHPAIVIAHGSVLAPGDSRPYPCINVDQVPGLDAVELFYCGHIHEYAGLVPVSEHTTFANMGSIGRTARTQANYARTVRALVVSITGNGLVYEEVPVPNVRPASEVFAVSEAAAAAPSADEIEAFVRVLGEGLSLETVTLEELIAAMPISDPRVASLVRQYLEEGGL